MCRFRRSATVLFRQPRTWKGGPSIPTVPRRTPGTAACSGQRATGQGSCRPSRRHDPGARAKGATPADGALSLPSFREGVEGGLRPSDSDVLANLELSRRTFDRFAAEDVWALRQADEVAH